MTKLRRPFLFPLTMLVLIAAIWSVTWLVTPKQQSLDQRVHDVASQLRCPICQGESVADSPSTISQQMREVIRQQLQAGRSEQEVIRYFVSRYGDQIVWVPQWQGLGLLVWLVPIGLLLVGGVLLFFVLRDWRSLSTVSSATEEDKDVERKLAGVDEQQLKLYRAQLEQELAADDPLFLTPSPGRVRADAGPYNDLERRDTSVKARLYDEVKAEPYKEAT